MLFELSLCIIAVTEKRIMKQEDAGTFSLPLTIASILIMMPTLARIALEDKPLFFSNFSKNKKCRVSAKWLERMRTIYEKDFFLKKQQELEVKGEKAFCITRGLLLKESLRRFETKPKLTDMETCTGFWNKQGCKHQWPICTRIGSSPMELSCFVFRVSERSYEIKDDYFYGEDETLAQHRRA